jgi:hypothetical protein
VHPKGITVFALDRMANDLGASDERRNGALAVEFDYPRLKALLSTSNDEITLDALKKVEGVQSTFEAEQGRELGIFSNNRKFWLDQK